MDHESEMQELYQAQSIKPILSGFASGLGLRFFGEPRTIARGWYMPFDEIDFQARDDLPHGGWPFPKTELSGTEVGRTAFGRLKMRAPDFADRPEHGHFA
jgi:hypothetical protein